MQSDKHFFSLRSFWVPLGFLTPYALLSIPEFANHTTIVVVALFHLIYDVWRIFGIYSPSRRSAQFSRESQWAFLGKTLIALGLWIIGWNVIKEYSADLNVLLKAAAELSYIGLFLVGVYMIFSALRGLILFGNTFVIETHNGHSDWVRRDHRYSLLSEKDVINAVEDEFLRAGEAFNPWTSGTVAALAFEQLHYSRYERSHLFQKDPRTFVPKAAAVWDAWWMLKRLHYTPNELKQELEDLIWSTMETTEWQRDPIIRAYWLNLHALGFRRDEIVRFKHGVDRFLGRHHTFYQANNEHLSNALTDPDRLSLPLLPISRSRGQSIHEWRNTTLAPYTKVQRYFLGSRNVKGEFDPSLLNLLFQAKLLTSDREESIRSFLCRHLAQSPSLTKADADILSQLDPDSSLADQGVRVAGVEDHSSTRGLDQGSVVYRITLDIRGNPISFFLKGLGRQRQAWAVKTGRHAEQYEVSFYKAARLMDLPTLACAYYPEARDPAMAGYTLMEDFTGVDSNFLFEESGYGFRMKLEFLPYREQIIKEFAQWAAFSDTLRKGDRKIIQWGAQFPGNYLVHIERLKQGRPAIQAIDHTWQFNPDNTSVTVDLQRRGNAELGILLAADALDPSRSNSSLREIYKDHYWATREKIWASREIFQDKIRLIFGADSYEFQNLNLFDESAYKIATQRNWRDQWLALHNFIARHPEAMDWAARTSPSLIPRRELHSRDLIEAIDPDTHQRSAVAIREAREKGLWHFVSVVLPFEVRDGRWTGRVLLTRKSSKDSAEGHFDLISKTVRYESDYFVTAVEASRDAALPFSRDRFKDAGLQGFPTVDAAQPGNPRNRELTQTFLIALEPQEIARDIPERNLELDTYATALPERQEEIVQARAERLASQAGLEWSHLASFEQEGYTNAARRYYSVGSCTLISLEKAVELRESNPGLFSDRFATFFGRDPQAQEATELLQGRMHAIALSMTPHVSHPRRIWRKIKSLWDKFRSGGGPGGVLGPPLQAGQNFIRLWVRDIKKLFDLSPRGALRVAG